jgi:hypothetical protein
MTVGTGEYNSPINERLTLSNLSPLPTCWDRRGTTVAESVGRPMWGRSNSPGVRGATQQDCNLALATVAFLIH